MSALDAKFIPIAFNLLKKFGKEVEYINYVQGVYDPNTQSSNRISSSFNVRTYIKGVKEEEMGDFELMVASKNFTDILPQIGDNIFNYKIVKIIPIYSGEEIALYKFRGVINE